LNIELNGTPKQIQETTLAQLCEGLGYGPEDKIATAVNGDFIAKDRREATLLSEGDRVEIVAPRQGG
jgi:sulfur carrier protein